MSFFYNLKNFTFSAASQFKKAFLLPMENINLLNNFTLCFTILMEPTEILHEKWNKTSENIYITVAGDQCHTTKT